MRKLNTKKQKQRQKNIKVCDLKPEKDAKGGVFDSFAYHPNGR
jgi:hypothetical protein